MAAVPTSPFRPTAPLPLLMLSPASPPTALVTPPLTVTVPLAVVVSVVLPAKAPAA